MLSLKLFKVCRLEGIKYIFQIWQRRTEVNNGENKTENDEYEQMVSSDH